MDLNYSKNRAKHCVKSVRIRSYSSPYFPAFGLKRYIQLLNQTILYYLALRESFSETRTSSTAVHP